jgi:DNA (cytosine-5)-methyltransferase 1
MSLGFKWAGWEPLVANDIDGSFLDTYRSNIHQTAIQGSISDDDVFNLLIDTVLANRNRSVPLAVLGGPPCQGFSTAGNRRSMDDERNRLFYRYRDVLVALKPEVYIFENVTGLMNMDGGAVFETVRRELSIEDFRVRASKLNAEEYGIPQRRTRLLITGTRGELGRFDPPEPVTQFKERLSLFGSLPPAVTVREALDDLPPLEPGEDGSTKEYAAEPKNPYQRLMRGRLSPEDYFDCLREGAREVGDADDTSLTSRLSIRM